MSKTVLLRVRAFAGGADLTGRSNKIELSAELEEKETTAFRSDDDPDAGWRTYLGGLMSISLSGAGQWEAGDPGMVDDAAWSALTGRGPVPWTVCPLSAAVGELAYSTSGLLTSYKVGDAVGEVAPWEAQASGSGVVARGVVMHPPGAARTADGAGDGLELGDLATGRMLATLHVLSVAGTSTPSLTVSVETSVDDDWLSPTEVAAFDTATAVGAQTLFIDAPITDEWWRVSWDITGTDPSFLFLVTLGVA